MESNNHLAIETKLYRIGEFAKYLGVTPDFLKHYEQLGIIKSIQSENGYRYFRFQDAMHIFECVKYKNLGFTLRELEPILKHKNEPDILSDLKAREAGLEKELQFQMSVLQAGRDFIREQEELGPDGSDWGISNVEPMLFLPHSRSRSFIDDPRIYRLLPHWVRCMPAVNTAALFPEEHPADFNVPSWYNDCVWGLIVSARTAAELDLPINDVVIELPACKALKYSFSADWQNSDNRPGKFTSLWQKLDSMNLRPHGHIIEITNIAVHLGSDVRWNQKYIVPLANK